MIKDNSRVIGMYGNNAIIGKVLTSRHYGNEFLYTVALDTPLSFRWRAVSYTHLTLPTIYSV